MSDGVRTVVHVVGRFNHARKDGNTYKITMLIPSCIANSDCHTVETLLVVSFCGKTLMSLFDIQSVNQMFERDVCMLGRYYNRV